MTHGFITIATGNVQYYKMAANLLHSYRYFSEKPLPFAIFADVKNEYTDEFDEVRLFSHAKRNYLDKLELFELLPYDINIFIDADCLAYGDLNCLFDVFEKADDFSCFGRVLPLDDKTGWFEYENLNDSLRREINYVVGLHGGIYYIRKTEKAKAVLECAREFTVDYSSYGFKGKFSTPGDEPVVALSMAKNNCKPIPHDLKRILCYWEHVGQMKLSVPQGIALAKDINLQTDLLHWGTRYTKTPLYRKQIADLKTVMNGGSNFSLYRNAIKYGIINAWEHTIHFTKRCFNKLKRIMHLK